MTADRVFDKLTHDEVAAAARTWLLGQSWAKVAATEIAYAEGRVDAVAASIPSDHERRLWRAEHARAAEAVRAGTRRRCLGTLLPPQRQPPRVGIVEAKATRSDLLADLRAKKMHKYAEAASRVWVACTIEALRLPLDRGFDRAERLAAVAGLDLPPGYGVLLVRRRTAVGANGARSPSPVVEVVRPARTQREMTDDECLGWVHRIARALTHRAAP